jgi:uncharacterized protein with ParB-like and HNH nuclease domain
LARRDDVGYRSESIAVAVGRLNQQYFLPAIEREFVWKTEQIVQLFDSIMRGYPNRRATGATA